tara:strand:+ start:439 stop:597 length:159 start_codon:yes stop_codon:yes gene_type:complete
LGVTTPKHLGAGEACWAHNPKVGGSKPSDAIIRLDTAISQNKTLLVLPFGVV